MNGDKTRIRDIVELKMVGMLSLAGIAIVEMIFGNADSTIIIPCITGIAALVGASMPTKS